MRCADIIKLIPTLQESYCSTAFFNKVKGGIKNKFGKRVTQLKISLINYSL